VHLHGFGKISYYRRYRRYEAVCTLHGCRLTKSSDASAVGRPSKGRPLGFMALWLQKQAEFNAKEEHRNPFAFAMLATMMDERRAARAFLKSLPDGEELCGTERPKRLYETSEPEDMP
jgi:hypothetical protein